jgi:lysophospholipase L1-like esterase
MNKEKRSERRPLLWKLVVALASVVLLIGGAELVARFVVKVQPKVERFQLHPDLGWEWTPGYDATETYYGVSYRMAISRQSLRNEEIIVPKPDGTYRIIVLGDSITEGPGVGLEDTFAKLLERSLRAAYPARPVEVINAGTGDYSTEQERIWLQERGLKYEPDLVILDIYLNDARTFTRPPALVAFVHNFFIQRSAFYYYYFNVLRGQRVEQEEASPDFRFRFSDTWKSRAWVTDPDTLTRLIQEANQDWGSAWNEHNLTRIEDNLVQIVQSTREHSIGLLLVLLPVDAQVYAQVDTPLGLDRPQQELISFARKQDVPVLDLLPVLRANRAQDLFYDQAHFRPTTHGLVADAILQALREQRLLP